jgi:molybdate/tungstate transport system substrate-binding protein
LPRSRRLSLLGTALSITIPVAILAHEERVEHPVLQPEASHSRAEVVVYHAGSLNTVVGEDIGPGFTVVTGVLVKSIGGPSVDLANRIRAGQIQPDVFMSADAEVNQVLIGQENGGVAPWYFTMCRQRMVVAYSPLSRFKKDFAAAAAGTTPWYEVLQTPGLVFKRSDPRNDPGGYRVVFLFQLAERYYKLPGLKDRVLQGDDNEAQIVHGDYAGLVKTGAADAVVTYITQAIFLNLPYISLPDELDQSNPAMKEIYVTAHYTNPQGQTFHGTPAVYSVTIPKGAHNQEGAEDFVRYLLSEPGRSALLRRGFPSMDVLVGGDETTVPHSLRALIYGPYSLSIH